MRPAKARGPLSSTARLMISIATLGAFLAAVKVDPAFGFILAFYGSFFLLLAFPGPPKRG